MRRIRARDFVFTAMIALAAYLLITQLAKIGFGTIADELRHAEIAWVVVGLVLAQLDLRRRRECRCAARSPRRFRCCPASCSSRRSSSST